MKAALAKIGLEHFADALSDLGVDAPGDVSYLSDAELQEAGFRLVHRRKLRELATGTGATPAPAISKSDTAESSASGVAAGCPNVVLNVSIISQLENTSFSAMRPTQERE